METDGDVATIRMYAPHVRIELRDDIAWLVVEHPSAEANATVRVSGSRGNVDGELGSRLQRPAGETVEVTVQRVLVDPHSVAAPRWQPWPIVRRRATETRDRLRPLLRI